jgi:Fuc2NAc and GlcNAc transferase
MQADAEVIFLGAGALALGALLTGLVRRVAMARGILDTPNARSSHTRVTPRGGGLAIVIVVVAGLLYCLARGLIDWRLASALVGGGISVAWIGFVDDRSSVSAGKRLLVHAVAAVWAVLVLGGLPALQLGDQAVELGLAGDTFTVVAIVWIINLFNFMDGTDGIAGAEAVTVTGLGGLLAAFSGGTAAGCAALVVCAASAGFLMWNWPPARIFMGDVGSGFLGFAIAVLALAAARDLPAAPWVWLILGGVFVVDATVTIIRRLMRRVRVSEAHREHAYQRLSRRWKSHGAVLALVMGLNLVWLAPCAWFAARRPDLSALAAGAALLPIVIATVLIGAGKPEESAQLR